MSGSLKGRIQKRTLADSEKIRARYEKLATRRMPIIVRGVGEPKLVTLTPRQLSDIRVDDERYQRMRNVEEVNQLIHVLRNGGFVPDPATIARRPDGTLWIVDGQQRFWAHLETETPMRALIYDVPNEDAERELFLVMNANVAVNANVKMFAWPGPVADFIRELNDSQASPFLGRINFGRHGARTFDAMVLCKAIFIAMTNLKPGGSVTEILRRADVAWQTDMSARLRARQFADLAAAAFIVEGSARTKAKLMPLMALAHVAYDRWQKNVYMPSPTIINALRRTNWDTIVPSHASRFMPVLRGEIERKWKQ